MKEKDKITYEQVRKEIASYITDSEELALIDKAYEFANEHHKNKKRLSGDAYITHPLNVALILTTLNVDATTLASALLHETINHGGSSKEEIESVFGEDIASIVDSISKINKLSLSDTKEQTKNNLKKVLVGLSSDVRVLFIKLADRLHNMRTMWALDPEDQYKKSVETESILIPIAHRLGINAIKSELEDLSLYYLKPDVYHDISEKLNQDDNKLQKELDKMKQELCNLLEEHHIEYKIKARVKSVHSLYNKLNKGKKWNEIYDILALRIIVNQVSDCYQVIGLIHSQYDYMPYRFKDYISHPKANMYQSLHTGIKDSDGTVFEVQIRTHEMDELAEKGIASHWSYKEHTKGGIQNNFEQKLELFRNTIEQQDDSSLIEEYDNAFQDETLNQMIYCFTPNGDVVELPSGATPVDFAYRIHSKVGDTTVGAIVNGVMVPLDSSLHDGDKVSIKTSKESTPNKEWLNFVKTSQAKNKIRSYFSKQDKEEYIKRGQENLEREIRRKKLSLTETLSVENINRVCEELNLDNLEEIYLSIGSLRYTAIYILNLLVSDHKEVQDVLLEKAYHHKKQEVDYKSDIIVAGCGDIKVSLASCCKPIKGDSIIGYISKGDGIIVHKNGCPNIKGATRLIAVSWNEALETIYYTDIEVNTSKGKNYLIDIINLASGNDIYIEEVKTEETSSEMHYKLTLKIKSIEALNKFLHLLKMQSFCLTVERVNA